MIDIAEIAVREALAAGAEYADARVQRRVREEIVLRNGEIATSDAPEELGLGVRVVCNGAFGFAARPWSARGGNHDDFASAAREIARRAVRSARELAPASRAPVDLGPRESHGAEYATPVSIDPFALGFAEKLDLLKAADSSMRGARETVAREASFSVRRDEQWQASSEGASIHQVQTRTGAGIATTAAAHRQVQRRSYPSSFGGDHKSGGFEHALALDLPAHGERVRDESVALCSADACPSGKRALILASNQLMLQIHESVGHPSELDRVFGHEVDLAGSSFATTEKLGKFRFGSPIVNLVADSTVAGGLDTRGFDDECAPSGRWHIVKDGILAGYLTSRAWAARIDESKSRACARAESWYSPPIIRITNLSLMPGTWTLDDLVRDTEDGVLCETVKMWSIDQRRLNFQFTTEIGWEIKDGKLGRMLRDPTYQGTTPEFWRSCDAICDASHWRLWGVPNCGKGNPMQVAEMSHGCSPARFRDVTFVR
jgi:TldD protein